MVPLVPAIYNRPPKPVVLSGFSRLLALVIAVGSLFVLVTAFRLTPNSSGLGTHQQLGMAPCNFSTQYGIPCLTCGMTTSFAYFVRGRLLASFYVQPMGMVLAGFTFLLFWFAGFEAVTGRNLHILIQLLPVNWILWASLILFIMAWAWKIGLVLTHHDGWTA